MLCVVLGQNGLCSGRTGRFASWLPLMQMLCLLPDTVCPGFRRTSRMPFGEVMLFVFTTYKQRRMDLNLKDKVVIVTGGAKGIGRAVVIALAKEGAIPVIVGRKKADNERVREEVAQLGANALAIEAELSIPEACKQAVEETLRVFGRIDGLVNNAGHNDGVGLISGNYERFVDSLHKNLIHYYLMAHHCIDALRVSRGSIVNISSKTAETGQGNTSAYA